MIAQPARLHDVDFGTDTQRSAPQLVRNFSDPTVKRHSTLDEVTYKVASTRQEREEAFRLVYDAYVESRLMEPNPFEMRVTPFHLVSTTHVFIATHKDRVISTMSLVHDDVDGLPMERVYPDEIDHLRERKSLSEITCLASDQGYFDRSRMFDIFVRLISLVGQTARFHGLDMMLLAVHPRHLRFYHRFFGCELIGGRRCYSSVRDNPAVACKHDFAKLDRTKYQLYDRSYSHRFQDWEMLYQPMIKDDLDYFEPVVEYCMAHTPVAA